MTTPIERVDEAMTTTKVVLGLLILAVFGAGLAECVSSPPPVAAQTTTIFGSDGTVGTSTNLGNGVQSYYDNRGTYGTVVTPPNSGISTYTFQQNGRTSTGTVLSVPTPPVTYPITPMAPLAPMGLQPAPIMVLPQGQ